MSTNLIQPNINIANSRAILALDSFDERDTPALVPAGTTATLRPLRIPGPVQLVRLGFTGVLPPGAGETLTLRLYRVRPASNPAGFGFIQLNDAYTVTTANFPGAGDAFDFSFTIRPNLCVLTGESLACSWVHVVGAGTMQPFNMNWSFTPVYGNEPEPAVSTLVWPPE